MTAHGLRRVTRVPALPGRPTDAHKGTFGTVLVIAGSDDMLGAAILCTRACLRGGAGLVRVALPPHLRAPFLGAVPCATAVPRRGAAAVTRALGAVTAAVVGPGLGATVSTRRVVRAMLQVARVPLVLDADALNVLAPLRAAPPLAASAPCVLTPHPGEAARLLGTDTRAVQMDRTAAVQELCRRSGAVVVLKGAGTLVCDGERCFKNRTGNPGMATGGAGDVLTGLLGALLAQGMAPFDAACLAVDAHGRAGDLAAQRLSMAGMTAEDLPLLLAEVLR